MSYNDIEKLDNVWMVQKAQQVDLSTKSIYMRDLLNGTLVNDFKGHLIDVIT